MTCTSTFSIFLLFTFMNFKDTVYGVNYKEYQISELDPWIKHYYYPYLHYDNNRNTKLNGALRCKDDRQCRIEIERFLNTLLLDNPSIADVYATKLKQTSKESPWLSSLFSEGYPENVYDSFYPDDSFNPYTSYNLDVFPYDSQLPALNQQALDHYREDPTRYLKSQNSFGTTPPFNYDESLFNYEQLFNNGLPAFWDDDANYINNLASETDSLKSKLARRSTDRQRPKFYRKNLKKRVTIGKARKDKARDIN